MTLEALIERQKENEVAIIDGGITRYRNSVEKAEAKGQAGSSMPNMWMLKQYIEPVSKFIQNYTDERLQGKAGRNAKAALIFDRLDPDVVAFVGIKTIQNMIFNVERKTRAGAAWKIGSALLEELQFDHMAATDSRTYKYWMKQADLTKDRQTKHRCYVRLKKNYSSLPKMERTDCYACGSIVIDALLMHTDMIENYYDGIRTKTHKPIECLRITLKYRAEIEALHSKAEALWPRYEPMLCPPKPWDRAFGCGFVGKLGRRTKLVRTHNRSYLEDINNYLSKMPMVLSALNAIQATPFRINKAMIAILGDAITARGGKPFCLPSMDDIPLPEKPKNFKTNKAAAIDYAATIKAIRIKNDKNESKRFAALLIHSLGEKYRDESAIYFAHNLDWRGRVYPLATCLSPQGDELSRAMLEFAEGLPLGTDEAVEWLAIHGAGCWGYDKVSFEDRIRWVEEHEQEIRNCVEAPLDFRWWAEADKPWMFLAWCHEWVGYLDTGKDFVSHIAIAMDGSCNGLQNFAAMLRHDETARAVNLTPSDVPNDIYQQVADKVKARVEALAVSDPRDDDEILAEVEARSVVEFSDEDVADEERKATADMWDILAARWIKDHIDRKLVKRPVMTYPYSVTMYGMRDQITDSLREMDGKTSYPIKHVGKVAGMLKVHVYEAICETVTAAARAMEWLKAAAKVVVKEEKPVSWVSPIGMLVLQDYRKQEITKINTRIGGTRLCSRVKEDTAIIDTRKQAAGIAPNFVHSCDASHLMFTVNACNTDGISSFQMIHDSYGTHASNAGTLARVLREQFVKMYGKQDVLAEFQAQLAQDVGSFIALVIPDSPTPGSYDLQQVLQSKYFFA